LSQFPSHSKLEIGEGLLKIEAFPSPCDGGVGAMERGAEISISCLVEYKAKKKREGERE
jgi:hypothetical protein